ncbi:hypothetical protein [Desulfospira joergensenii]|uniref:hypothetical protein n=1 Tax=Desulfospira joergensenii TaxID=53329 RepID=UPI0003B6B2B2|nr:hypothetical protein [Desulfospira joergensenii]
MTDDAVAFPDGSRIFLRSLAADHPELFKAVVRFNASVNRKNSVSKEADGSAVNAVINGSKRAAARLNGKFTRGFWDFEEESRRMALLDSKTLKTLLFTWGAAFCAPLLCRFVQKQDLEILHRDMEPGYTDFALKRGRFFLGDFDGIIRLDEAGAKAEQMPDLIMKHSMRAHEICLRYWPEPLRELQAEKIKLDLPDWFERKPEMDRPHPSHPRAVWFSFKKILLKEVAPEWTPCFF